MADGGGVCISSNPVPLEKVGYHLCTEAWVATFHSQSLLVALGSIQFVSNTYFVLNKTVMSKLIFYRVLVATTFVVLGNIFLVAFGNHQSLVYMLEQLVKYSDIVFLFYCMISMVIAAANHSI
ncbi:probable magnesium transporter NIPA8 isoform X1 [Magnolia sinica]|uniref:probable magnesium transporter NIPA8 isoform X1 n=1 Tax=Magnolia sinica TaxID=86752 RepID=UPI002658BFD4|nr:probable magnesium transporter NIPA8 isoform X1 [Magnolia sinica]